MILIISDDIFSVHDIINILHHTNQKFVRINKNTKIEIKEIVISEVSCKILIEIDKVPILLDDIKSVLIRKGEIQIQNVLDRIEGDLIDESESIINLKYESNKVIELIIDFLNRNSLVIGNYYRQNVNKLIVLSLASKLGLKIPATLISSSISEINLFNRVHQKCITKPIGEIPSIKTKEIDYKALTSIIGSKTNNLKNISVSKIQKQVDKLFEIRVFFFFGNCFSMAIFSQQNEKTISDFRNYDYEKDNRNVPYKLPNIIEVRIQLLMRQLNLNTGSIDFIYSKEKEFIFLEINPTGQYGMVSASCNYHLDYLFTNKLSIIWF